MEEERYTEKETEMYCLGKQAGVLMMCEFLGWELLDAQPRRHFWRLRHIASGEEKVITTNPWDLDEGKRIQVFEPQAV